MKTVVRNLMISMTIVLYYECVCLVGELTSITFLRVLACFLIPKSRKKGVIPNCDIPSLLMQAVVSKGFSTDVH